MVKCDYRNTNIYLMIINSSKTPRVKVYNVILKLYSKNRYANIYEDSFTTK